MIKNDNDYIEEQLKEMQRWSSMVTRKLKTNARQFTHGKQGFVLRGKKSGETHGENKLVSSLNKKVYVKGGIPEGIGFKIERHGVFVQKGVGRGHISQNGFVLRGNNPSKEAMLYAKSQNRRAPGKQTTGGQVNRRPVDWFNSVIEATLPELCDRIAEINVNAIIRKGKIIIK